MLIFLRGLSYLPLWLLYGLFSPLAYVVLRFVLRYRRAVVTKNLRNAFPGLSQAELKRLRTKYYRHLAILLPEVIKSLSASQDELVKRVSFVNPEILKPLTDAKQSAMFLAAHHCNWEWIGLTLGHYLGAPVDSLYRPLHNATGDALMLASRSRFGSRPITDKSAAKTMLRRRKEFRGFGLVADQRPNPWGEQYWTTFLNQRSSFFVGPDRLARLLKYPVFMLAMRRVSLGYYEVEIVPLASPPYDEDQENIVELYVREAEKAIHQQPETYLWSHDKWRE